MLNHGCLNSTVFSPLYRSAMLVVVVCLFSAGQLSLAQDRCDVAQDLGQGACMSFFNGPATADPGTGQFCSDYENNLWYTFVAQATTTTVVLIPTYCVNDGGLEIEIFQANFCSVFDPILACQRTPGVIPVSIQLPTTIGETYYIITDGYRGDICDYKINLIHGTCATNPSVCDSLSPITISGQEEICFGQGTYTYQIENYSPNLETLWYIEGLPSYVDLGDGKIEIDWSTWQGLGNPVIFAAQYDYANCMTTQTSLVVSNTNPGFGTDPQDQYFCPFQFPIDLEPLINVLFVNLLTPFPPDFRYKFYLTREDMLNNTNPVTVLDTPGVYTIYTSWSMGNCFDVPMPNDSATIFTQYLDLEAHVNSYCEGEEFLMYEDVRIEELNNFPGWIFDSVRFYESALDAYNWENQLDETYGVLDDGKYWARFVSSIGCSDTVSFEIEFDKIPVFSVIHPDTICSQLGNASYDLESTTFNFTTGDRSTVTMYYYRTYDNAIDDFNRISPIVSTTGDYYAVAVSDAGCRGEPVQIDVVFLISPYVEVFGSGDFCVGDTADLLITAFNTPTPYFVIIEDDFGGRDTIIGNQSSFFYEVIVNKTTRYEIVDFYSQFPAYCPYISNADIYLEIIRLPDATLELVVDCGEQTGVYWRASLNGEYAAYLRKANTGDTFEFTGELNDTFLPIPLFDGDVLVLDSFQYDSACWSYITDTVGPVVLQPPLAVDSVALGPCNPLSSIVTFSISGGDINTYEVSGIPGVLLGDGSSFQSLPLAAGSYTAVVADGRGCDSVLVDIVVDCACISSAGQLTTVDTNLCVNDMTAVIVSDTILAPNDEYQFVLHTLPPPNMGEWLASNATGQFAFQSGTFSFGETYYISLIIGPPGLNGVDTAAYCSVFSNAVPVRWYDVPVVNYFDTLKLCESPVDTSVFLQFSGTPPYTFSYTVDGTNGGPLTTDLNEYRLTLAGLSESTTFTVVSISNPGCVGQSIGQGIIDFPAGPMVTAVEYVCNSTRDSFYVEVQVEEGSLPYAFSGIDGEWDGSLFTSVFLPSGYNGLLSIADAVNCTSIELPINRDCDCESTPAVLPNIELFLCQDSVYTIIPEMSEIVFPNDRHGYLIKSNDQLDTSGILSIQSNTTVQYDPSFMEYGTTYYIMPAVSFDLLGELDLSHKCFLANVGIPFVFYENPVAYVDVSTSTLTCADPEIMLDASTSVVPVGFFFEWIVISGAIDHGDETLQPTVSQAGTYQLVIRHPNAPCTSEFTIEIESNKLEPEATIVGDTLIQCLAPSVMLNGALSQPLGDVRFDWSTQIGNILSATNMSQIEVDESGWYQLIVEHVTSFCRDTIQFFVDKNIDRPNANIIPDITEINCQNARLLIRADSSLIAAADEITWNSSSAFNPLTGYTIETNAAGVYYLIAKNEISNCSDTAQVVITENTIIPEVVLADSFFIDCQQEKATLQVMIANDDGGGYGYAWRYAVDGVQGDSLSDQIVATQSGQYLIEVTDLENGCTQLTSAAVIASQEPIYDLDLQVENSPCFEIDNGSMVLSQVIGGEAPYAITLDGSNLSNELPVSQYRLAEGSYNLHVEDINGCAFDTVFEVRNLRDISVDLPEYVLVDEGGSVQIDPRVVGVLDTFCYFRDDTLWSDLQSLTPEIFPDRNMEVGLVVVSLDSCTATDQMRIIIKFVYDVFIPSAFSPNADQNNDRLEIYGPPKLKKILFFNIYNRWGGKVYGREDFSIQDQHLFWDGTIQGELANEGVYSYVAQVEFSDGTIRNITGDFTLIR